MQSKHVVWPGILLAAMTLPGCGDRQEPANSTSIVPSATGIEAVDARVRGQAAADAGSNEPVRGHIEARFDGRDLHWNISTLADPTRMSAGMVSSHGTSGFDVSLRGVAPAGAEGSLSIELSYSGNTLSPQARRMGESLTLIPHAGIVPPHWNAMDDLSVTLTQAGFDGLSGRIEGSFTATLCHRAGMFDRPDPANCRPIAGRFASDLAAEAM